MYTLLFEINYEVKYIEIHCRIKMFNQLIGYLSKLIQKCSEC